MPEPAADVTESGALGAPDGSAVPPTRPRPRTALPRPDRREVAAVFAGGALGTLARAALAEAFPHAATAWPWPTFGVNIVAAFLLGYFVTRLQERLPLSSDRRPLLVVGGPRFDESMAGELGVDRVFTRGTTPGEVASFLVHRLTRGAAA